MFAQPATVGLGGDEESGVSSLQTRQGILPTWQRVPYEVAGAKTAGRRIAWEEARAWIRSPAMNTDLRLGGSC